MSEGHFALSLGLGFVMFLLGVAIGRLRKRAEIVRGLDQAIRLYEIRVRLWDDTTGEALVAAAERLEGGE